MQPRLHLTSLVNQVPSDNISLFSSTSSTSTLFPSLFVHAKWRNTSILLHRRFRCCLFRMILSALARLDLRSFPVTQAQLAPSNSCQHIINPNSRSIRFLHQLTNTHAHTYPQAVRLAAFALQYAARLSGPRIRPSRCHFGTLDRCPTCSRVAGLRPLSRPLANPPSRSRSDYCPRSTRAIDAVTKLLASCTFVQWAVCLSKSYKERAIGFVPSALGYIHIALASWCPAPRKPPDWCDSMLPYHSGRGTDLDRGGMSRSVEGRCMPFITMSMLSQGAIARIVRL